MLTPYGVGCAFVRVGTWSSLLPIGTTHVSFYRYSPDFKLNGCCSKEEQGETKSVRKAKKFSLTTKLFKNAILFAKKNDYLCNYK